ERDRLARETRVRDDAPQRALELAHVRADPLRDEERHLLRELLAFSRRLRHQDRDTRLELGRLDRDRQSPAEARLQPFLEAGDLLRIAVAGQDDLTLALEQRVERVEELFLRALLAGEKLDIVDQERIERAIRALELVDRVVLQAAHHVADETLRVHVRDLRVGVAAQDRVADRVHQMRFAQAYAAVDEQRVVGRAGILADLHRRGARELVALPLDERLEREGRVQAAAEELRGAGLRLAVARRDHGRRRPPAAADLEINLASPAVLGPPAPDPIEAVGFDPIDDEAIRSEQPHRAVPVLDGLQRTDPRVQ